MFFNRKSPILAVALGAASLVACGGPAASGGIDDELALADAGSPTASTMQGPQTPNADDPQKPGADDPHSPNADDPQSPNADDPQNPSAGDPGSPNAEQPEGPSGNGSSPSPLPSECDDPELDTDADGLGDCEERVLRTSPILADTDGDGFDDKAEVELFNASANYKFNPRIADVPKLRFQMTSVPTLGLTYETTDGTEHTVSAERSEESAMTLTTSESTTNATSVEETHSAGVSLSVGYTWGATGGANVEATVSYGYSHATTNETSMTWSEEQARENREAYSEGQSFAKSNAVTTSGGSLITTLSVFNEGNVAFTVDNLVVSAVTHDPARYPSVSPIGNLSLDTTFASFPSFSLAPGASADDMVFANTELSVETISSLLRDSNGLTLKVAAYEITDANGNSYSHNFTDIAARDATVLIDYGVERPSERFLVSTSFDPSRGNVPAAEILGDVVNIDFAADSGELTAVRNVAADAARSASWLVVHASGDGVEIDTTTYDEDYDFNDIDLRAGDLLHLVYLEDADGDRLGTRQEFHHGTDPENPDTDDDGINDFDEVQGWAISVLGQAGESNIEVNSDPRSTDSDLDGVSDTDEQAQGTNPRNPDTDGDLLEDSRDFAPTTYSSLGIAQLASQFVPQVVLADSSVELSWQNPVLPAGTTQEVMVVRQIIDEGEFQGIVAEPANDETYQVGDGFRCQETNEECWRVVYVGNANALTDAELTGLSAQGSRIRYRVYVGINGAWIRSNEQATLSPNQPTDDIVVDLKGISMLSCLDGAARTLGIYLPSDVTCELYYEVKIDGEVVNELPKSSQVSMTAGDNHNIDQQVSIAVPGLEDSCFELEAIIYEADTPDHFSYAGDPHRYHAQKFCHDGTSWLPTGDFVFTTPEYGFPGSLAPQYHEFATRARLHYSVTVN